MHPLEPAHSGKNLRFVLDESATLKGGAAVKAYFALFIITFNGANGADSVGNINAFPRNAAVIILGNN